MSTDYNYDEQGQFFPYFILTITALFTVPCTYSALKPSAQLENTAPRISSDFEPEHADLIENQRKKQKRRERKMKRMVAAMIGWAVMAWMVYLMAVTARTIPKIWDPYEVLGIKRGMEEKAIVKYYRKLSLTHHPDKRRPDPAKNETVEMISDQWVEMSRAFKALTDEDVRRNYELYGNPDGRQQTSIGIALPQWIVAEGNGKYVLVLYGALLAVVLPALVGSWWYGSQKTTKEKVLVGSAGKLFKEYNEEMTEGAIISALSAGQEYETVVKPESSYASVERRVLKAGDNSMGLRNEDREKLSTMSDDQRRQALSLLWAYLGRADLGDAVFNEQKYAAATVAFALNESFLAMAPFFGNTQPLLSSYRTSQSLIQALPPNASPLLQLPHITRADAENIDAELGTKNATIQHFMTLPETHRRKLLSTLTAPQFGTAMSVASQLPYARVEKAFFKVTGERYITPGSLISFVIKLRVIPPGHPIPPVSPADLEDPDPKEGDLDALHGRKKGKSSDSEDDKPIQPPLAHAPYFGEDHSPRWRVFLAENKSGKIAVPPFTFSTFDKPLFTYNTDGENSPPKPTCNVQTLKCTFQAPGQAGEYPFTMHLVCDSYIGLDSERDVIMKVDEMSKAEEVESEDEISEAESDTIAGQMAALKSGVSPTTSTPKRKKKPAVPQTADDISSGSDTEGDADDSDDSDTDTDTDTSDEE